jgi:LysM repeat protein
MARLSRLVLTMSLCAAAVAAPAIAQAAPNGTYVVKDGDYLIGIASQFGVSLAELLNVNDLTISSVIYPGQRLRLPGGATGGGASAATGYTVVAGDTLFGIATRHGVSLSALLAANGLGEDSLIMPGMRLRLPSGAGAPAAPSPAAGSYTVVAGDSLFAIAHRHEVSLSALLAASRLSVDTVIMPGMQIRLPSGARAPSAPAAPSPSGGPRYTVQAGDTLFGIASSHGVSLSSLLSASGLSADSMITPGMELRLPTGARQTPNTGTGIDRVVAYAFAQVGKPYKFFTKGPSTFDCSGLTLAAYAQIGVTLVHHSASQSYQGTAVDFRNEPIRAGDLIFRTTMGSSTINHVGLAVSSTMWIQARRTGIPIQYVPIPPDSEIVAVRRLISSG